jgi:hypothetical protein
MSWNLADGQRYVMRAVIGRGKAVVVGCCQNVGGPGLGRLLSATPAGFPLGNDIDTANLARHDWPRLTATRIGVARSHRAGTRGAALLLRSGCRAWNVGEMADGLVTATLKA